MRLWCMTTYAYTKGCFTADGIIPPGLQFISRKLIGKPPVERLQIRVIFASGETHTVRSPYAA